ncbi:hypothetical protein BATDEDRAFT_26090 [Batrachochytrium dendrobatidis JAM81]|uniref:Uncharacterized protein n=1 Tax=Batrachochytrium dendrobatidis (strain JAM81 / FGSC 10211) TaxID=684364 RepID=F4P709_BATDJ|nr:hypothetical protein BATDEDRAFT_26090 [Batrachochytrium dendrobatidis JAM81]|eukprot:XP_006680303.1 hypothetical protein BATDEDRAFT_26090 [Batrachochytrium dendrobatidis JAM81]
MTTGRINQHRLVQTLGQLVIQKCHDLWTWSSCPWDIWTWSLGHGPFGHGPPSDPPVLGTWPSDTVSSDMVLGHRVFGHHPRTFPTSPSIPLPLDTYLAVRRLFGLGHYLTKSPVTKPVPYHVICNNAHAMAWSDSHIKWGPFQTQLTNHVTMFGLPRLRKRYPIVSFPSGHCHCTKYNNAVHSKRNSPTMLPYYVTMFGLPVCGNNTQLYHSQVDICHQMTILHCRSPSFNISTPTLCFEYHFPLDHHGSCVALPSCLRRAHHLLFQSLKIAYINVYSSCVYHVFTPFV